MNQLLLLLISYLRSEVRLQSVSYLFFRDKSAWSVTQRSWDPYSQVLQNKRGREKHTRLLNLNAKQSR